MPIPRLNVKFSTFALRTETDLDPSGHSFARTEPSSTRTTSSAIGNLLNRLFNYKNERTRLNAIKTLRGLFRRLCRSVRLIKMAPK